MDVKRQVWVKQPDGVSMKAVEIAKDAPFITFLSVDENHCDLVKLPYCDRGCFTHGGWLTCEHPIPERVGDVIRHTDSLLTFEEKKAYEDMRCWTE